MLHKQLANADLTHLEDAVESEEHVQRLSEVTLTLNRDLYTR